MAHNAALDHLDDDQDDTRIDAYYDGYGARQLGRARPDNADGAAGWDDAARDERVRVVMPSRPEGYYHAPIGTFD